MWGGTRVPAESQPWHAMCVRSQLQMTRALANIFTAAS